MHSNIRQVSFKPVDSGVSDELTVVELDSLQVEADVEVVEGGVCDQRTVVQLQNGQGLGGAHTASKMADSFVSYQLTMRKTQFR